MNSGIESIFVKETPREYYPDGWVIVKFILEGETIFKVFASWSGGYLSGDSWKFSSAITCIQEEEGYYKVHGTSGSIYLLSKDSEDRISAWNGSVLCSILETLDSSEVCCIVEAVEGLKEK